MAKAPAKKSAATKKKAAPKAAIAEKKLVAKKAAAKKAAAPKVASKKKATKAKVVTKKAVTKKTAAKKPAAKKSKKASAKQISGYGMGSVDVVMSVDQVVKEAASIAGEAPSLEKLGKLAKNEPFLSIDNLNAGYGKMEILHNFTLQIGRASLYALLVQTVLANLQSCILSLALPISSQEKFL